MPARKVHYNLPSQIKPIELKKGTKGPVTLLRMRETYEKRMKINKIIFIYAQKSFEMSAYEYRTSGVPVVYSACA